MLIEADLVAESLVADVASERPLPVVRPPGVDFQSMRSGEHFLALDAREIASVAAGPVAAVAAAGYSALVETLERIRMARMLLLDAASVE